MTENNQIGGNIPDTAIKPVPLFEATSSGAVRCKVCGIGCELLEGQSGVCKVRTNRAGNLIALNYGIISHADLERVERKYLYHFFPGTKVFSVGGYGLNYPKVGEVAHTDDFPAGNIRVLPVEKIVKFSIEQHCRGVVFAYNEPSMWYEFLYDAMRLVKANGMFTAIVTNGYFTTEVLNNIGDYLDGILLEINSFNEETFQVFSGQTQFQQILENASQAQHKFKVHVEINTKIVPGINDSATEMKTIAAWIKQALGETTPWHLSLAGDGNPAILYYIKSLAEENGLKYVYLHNVEQQKIQLATSGVTINSDNTAGGNTFCYKCHRLLISRTETEANSTGLERDRCTYCGVETSVHNTIWKL
ncbi:radical SAM protein [Candidatus Chlorohelix sp.]|uniref:radical SAM protein n=1 Tax=Candidatus Chlorohelix sp. TaxID=3139201 RepID=UPI00306B6F1C